MKTRPSLSSLIRTEIFLQGRWISAEGDARFSVKNPATQEVLSLVSKAGVLETKQAIEGAHAAGLLWRSQVAQDRSNKLRTWFDQIRKHREELAWLITLEQGKPLTEARLEVDYAASFVEWFAEEAKRAYGNVIPSTVNKQNLLVLKQPVGVVAAITPWNFPLAMVTRKCAPALAAGCTVVLKPAEQTPLSALALAWLAQQADFPPGILQVLPTDSPAEVGDVVTSHSLVRKLSFTGSTEIGKLLMKQCAGTVKRLSLELGGHAPVLVFADADVSQAVQSVLYSKYRNTGQSCICANRIWVQESVYEAFAQQLAEQVSQLSVGPGWEEGVQLGPLINQQAVQKVEEHIKDALQQGADCLVGGQRHVRGGNFFEPTVLTNVHSSMRISQEETFGPVAPLFRFSTEAEVIAEANRTSYGLAAYVYTQNLGRAFRVAKALEYGMVGVNESRISTAVAPFGGWKESGLGREGSTYGLDEYLEMKYICIAE